MTRHIPESLFPDEACEPEPRRWTFPITNDPVNLRDDLDSLNEDDEVIITELLGGLPARYVHDGCRLWAGSKYQVIKHDRKNTYWLVAERHNLVGMLYHVPFHVFSGNIIKTKSDVQFYASDVYDIKCSRFLEQTSANKLITKWRLPCVPILYVGPWSPELLSLSREISSIIPNRQRRGIIIKHTNDNTLERVIIRYDRKR